MKHTCPSCAHSPELATTEQDGAFTCPGCDRHFAVFGARVLAPQPIHSLRDLRRGDWILARYLRGVSAEGLLTSCLRGQVRRVRWFNRGVVISHLHGGCDTVPPVAVIGVIRREEA